MTLATVESQADPRRPGRTGYLITGPSIGAVQDAIDTLTRTVDPTCGGACGLARFIGPVRVDGQFSALGEVIVEKEDA